MPGPHGSSGGRRLMALTLIAMAAIGSHSDTNDGSWLAAIGSRPAAAPTTARCTGRDDCGAPLKSGLRITFTGWSCTTGFIARGIEDRKLYVVTAGHCIAGSGLFAQWSHHDSVIGRAALDAFEEDSSADAGAIEIAVEDASNEMYATSSDDIRQVTAFAPDSAQALGTEVCRSGGTSGWTCGHIVGVAVDTTISGKHIRHTWWTDFPSAPGDSGSPVTDLDGRLFGIVVATTATQSVYATIEDVTTALDVRPCLEARCFWSRKPVLPRRCGEDEVRVVPHVDL